MDNHVENPQAPIQLVCAVARNWYAWVPHAKLVQSLDSDRLALASSASWANVIDDSRVSADRVSVYRMVYAAVADSCFLHESDDRLEGLRVLGGIAVQLYIADVARVCEVVIRRLDRDLLESSDREVYRHVEGVCVVIPVSDARQLAVLLSVDLDESAGESLSRCSQQSEVEAGLRALSVAELSHVLDDLECLLSDSLVLAVSRA